MEWCPHSKIWWSDLFLNTLVDCPPLKLTVCTCRRKAFCPSKDNSTRLPFLAIFRVPTLLGLWEATSLLPSKTAWSLNGYSFWICWKRCLGESSKQYSPKWWDLLVIYHGTIPKKSPTKTDPSPVNQQNRLDNPPPIFPWHFLQDIFFGFFFCGFSSLKIPHNGSIHASFFSCRENLLPRFWRGFGSNSFGFCLVPHLRLNIRWCSCPPLRYKDHQQKQVDKKNAFHFKGPKGGG